ncbi:MAG: sodium:proton antiporter [Thermoflavifilum sp.]|nr:sodium:proton antiporter [Thermoflavifilum sp.]MCL6514184.1 sodium:proton antiporter [Alicyclobacillus sp.]
MLQMADWESALAVLWLVVAGGLVVCKLTERPRIPDVAACLLLGIALGPAGLHWLQEPSGSQANQFILNLGALLIVFEGGRGVQFRILREVWLSISLLAVAGVLVTAAVVAAALHGVFAVPWLPALLLASVLSSTDPATLIPVFQRVPIWPRLQQTVESESAFNDATASVLVFALLGVLDAGTVHAWWQPVMAFLQSALVGLATGLACSLLALWLVSARGWGVLAEYSTLVLVVLALGSFEAAARLGGSGLMAAFTAGVVAGNSKSFGWPLSEREEARGHHFLGSITLVMRMLIFVLLGTQVDFQAVQAYAGEGMLAVVVLMLLARPLAVLVCVLPDRRVRWRWREVVFMFWVRETGVIPAALAGMLAARGVPGAAAIQAVTFLAILATILVQASSTGWVARKLGVALPPRQETV